MSFFLIIRTAHHATTVPMDAIRKSIAILVLINIARTVVSFKDCALIVRKTMFWRNQVVDVRRGNIWNMTWTAMIVIIIVFSVALIQKIVQNVETFLKSLIILVSAFKDLLKIRLEILVLFNVDVVKIVHLSIILVFAFKGLLW
jgi:hypothetical protein